MGMTANLILLPCKVELASLRELLSEVLSPNLKSKQHCFYSHPVPDPGLHLLSFDVEPVDFEVVGMTISKFLGCPVWMISILDGAGLEGAWRFADGSLKNGFVNHDPKELRLKDGYPNAVFSEEPIDQCFADSPLKSLDYEELLTKGEEEELLFCNYEEDQRAKMNKRWWQFWK